MADLKIVFQFKRDGKVLAEEEKTLAPDLFEAVKDPSGQIELLMQPLISKAMHKTLTIIKDEKGND